jgi:hypothetical protein
MSFDKQLRAMIQEEIQSVIAPLADAIGQLQQGSDVASQLRALLGGSAKRGPGRPPKVSVLGRTPVASGPKRGRKPGRPAAQERACAILACKRPARSKGYCSSHYQKRRMLQATKRLPSDWTENADAQSVKDLFLPRGRAAVRALAASKK